MKVRAVHVNHGLHPNAVQWSERCCELARRLHVPLDVIVTRVSRSTGDSLEAAARDARYTVLAQSLQEGEFLLTAH
ncbi:ATP-binding protein, partial [Acinetobacter baumannii]